MQRLNVFGKEQWDLVLNCKQVLSGSVLRPEVQQQALLVIQEVLLDLSLVDQRMLRLGSAQRLHANSRQTQDLVLDYSMPESS